MPDHDQLWKRLLQRFLREFMEEFLPEEARRLDFRRVR
ncbi:MAG: transposase, partial [Armatimonadetes bacterium CG_4_10_14_3_um_filter_66_18]